MSYAIVPEEIKQRIFDKVKECLKIAETKYGMKFNHPRTTYDIRGTTAGRADYKAWHVMFNPVLLLANIEHFIASTVVHEVAHLVTDKVYPEAHKRTFKEPKRSPHGHQWQSVMRALGIPFPTRCHSYDTTAVKQSKQHYQYQCTGCDKIIPLGPKRHAKMLKNHVAYTHRCGKQGTLRYMTPFRTPGVTSTHKVAQAIKVPAAGTKLRTCYDLFENYSGATRTEMINHFVQLAGCTAAGAATYYATCKKIQMG